MGTQWRSQRNIKSNQCNAGIILASKNTIKKRSCYKLESKQPDAMNLDSSKHDINYFLTELNNNTAPRQWRTSSQKQDKNDKNKIYQQLACRTLVTKWGPETMRLSTAAQPAKEVKYVRLQARSLRTHFKGDIYCCLTKSQEGLDSGQPWQFQFMLWSQSSIFQKWTLTQHLPKLEMAPFIPQWLREQLINRERRFPSPNCFVYHRLECFDMQGRYQQKCNKEEE